ncbi:MAG TPA: hypothetical protein VHO73_04050 [Methylomirabilota bacterium]|jgi:hypothetical protein|nr:hypothetical protein [Methylomirabilota bacterium]
MGHRALVVGLALLGLAACRSGGLPPAQVEAWVGRSAADLAKEWGAPTKEVQEDGQRVLIYEELERTTTTEFASQVSPRVTSQGVTVPPPTTVGTTSYARSYLFWVDAAGKITRTQIRQR